MTFSVNYLSGLSSFKSPATLSLRVDSKSEKLYFSRGNSTQHISFDKLLDVSFTENYKRSAGKAAAGAIVGGLLTGGIGAIVGAGVGARRSTDNSLFITYAVGTLDQKIILKGKNLTQVQSAILRAIEAAARQREFEQQYGQTSGNDVEAKISDNHTRAMESIKKKQTQEDELGTIGVVFFIVLIFVLWMSCS